MVHRGSITSLTMVAALIAGTYGCGDASNGTDTGGGAQSQVLGAAVAAVSRQITASGVTTARPVVFRNTPNSKTVPAGSKSASSKAQAPGCGRPAHLTSLGGRITGPTVTLLPVFWGNVASDTRTSISTFLNVIGNSSWLTQIQSEYGFPQPLMASTPTFPGVTITPQVSTGSTVTDSDIQAELNWQISNHFLPSGGAYLYLLHFAPGVTPQLDAFGTGLVDACTPDPNFFFAYWCAYHGTLGGTQSLYAVIPDHSAGNCSVNFCASVPSSLAAMQVGESHEIAEALTDPDIATGFRDYSSSSPCAGAEIGDICGGQALTITAGVGTTWVQAEWSNKANACVSSPAGLADMDGDGRSDLALTGGVGWATMPVAFSSGDGTYHGTNAGETSGDTGFPDYAQVSGAKPVAGDFDGDGFADIALVGGAGWATMPIAFSNGDGTYRGANAGEISGDTGFADYAQQSGAKPVAGDFNGDGLADIALVGGVGWATMPIAFSNGDGTYHGTNAGETSGDTGFADYAQVAGAVPVSGDFNCDGLDDIALVGGQGWATMPIAFSNGDGTYRGANGGPTTGDTGFPFYAQVAGARPVAGDFNGDCFADLALTGGGGWATMPIAFSNGDGTYRGTNEAEIFGDTGFADYAQATGALPVAGDFNADGFSDIALTGGQGWGTMPIAFSNGDGTYHGSNQGEASGDTGFPGYAQQTGAVPVSR